MKFLRLSCRDTNYKKSQNLTWNLPMVIGQSEVALSSIYLHFNQAYYDSFYKNQIIPMECNIIGNNMWNPRAILYNVNAGIPDLGLSTSPGTLGDSS